MDAIEVTAAECGAVSEEAIRHLEIRDQLNRTIYRAIRGYNMTNMVYADDHHCPFPLVDLMSEDGADIGAGEMEMIALADEVAEAVMNHRTTSSAGLVEALEALADSCALRSLRGYDHVPSMRLQQNAIRAARAILAEPVEVKP